MHFDFINIQLTCFPLISGSDCFFFHWLILLDMPSLAFHFPVIFRTGYFKIYTYLTMLACYNFSVLLIQEHIRIRSCFQSKSNLLLLLSPSALPSVFISDITSAILSFSIASRYGAVCKRNMHILNEHINGTSVFFIYE